MKRISKESPRLHSMQAGETTKHSRAAFIGQAAKGKRGCLIPRRNVGEQELVVSEINYPVKLTSTDHTFQIVTSNPHSSMWGATLRRNSNLALHLRHVTSCVPCSKGLCSMKSGSR